MEKINNWTFQWKMNFNPGPIKQAQESFLATTKRNKSSSVRV